MRDGSSHSAYDLLAPKEHVQTKTSGFSFATTTVFCAPLTQCSRAMRCGFIEQFVPIVLVVCGPALYSRMQNLSFKFCRGISTGGACVCVCVQIYIYIYVYVYICVYIYTRVCVCVCSSCQGRPCGISWISGSGLMGTGQHSLSHACFRGNQ